MEREERGVHDGFTYIHVTDTKQYWQNSKQESLGNPSTVGTSPVDSSPLPSCWNLNSSSSLSLSLAWTEISPHSLACWNLYTSLHPMNLVFCFIESYVFKYVAFQATCLVVVLSIDDPEPPGICSWGQCTRTGHMLTSLQHFTMLYFRWRRQYMYDIISFFPSPHKHMLRTLRLDPRVFNLFRFWSRISL